MEDQRAGIVGFGGYVPDQVMTNDDWAEHLDTTDEWITTRTGIKERRLVGDDQATVDLGIAAAEVALKDAGLVAGDLDEIIVATDTPEAMSPDTAAYIQHRLGAGEIPSYDLGGSGCAGFVLGLDLACSRARGGRRVLVIGVEVITRIMDWTDRSTAVLFGDAAGAVVVGTEGYVAEIEAFTAGTDGSQAHILGLLTGGTRRPVTAEIVARNEQRHITMNGREVFRHATARMSQASLEVLEIAGLGPDDIDLVIPHQANLRIIEAVRKVLGLPEEKVVTNLQHYGNTGSASVPLALWEARRDGRIGAGDRVLLTSFGAGFHWAAALLKF